MPRTLVSMKSSGDRMLRSTCDSAAKWTIASMLLVVQHGGKEGAVAYVPSHETVTRVALQRRKDAVEVSGVRQLVERDQTCAGRWLATYRTKAEPIKPAPPVTSRFMWIGFPSRSSGVHR